MRGVLVFSCLCLCAPQVLAQRVTVSGELGLRRARYPQPEADSAAVTPVAGPFVGVRVGLRLVERVKPAHRAQLEFRLAYSPELVVVRRARYQLPEGERRVTDQTGHAVFMSAQFEVTVPGGFYLGVGPGTVRRGRPVENTDGRFQNGFAMSMGIGPYVWNRVDLRASLETLTTDFRHGDFQFSLGFTVAMGKRPAAP